MSASSASPFDEAKRKEIFAEVSEKDMPLLLGVIEKQLQQNVSKEFLIGNQITIADFYVMGMYIHFMALPPVKEMLEKCQTCPLLKDYIQKRTNAIKQTTPDPVKLYDFEGTNYKGEVIRLILRHTKIPFEDCRIKQAEWPSKKDTFPLKQLPVLECHGHQKVQTNSIVHSLCLTKGFIPLEPQKYSQVLEVVGIIDDVAMGYAFAMMPNLTEEQKKKLLEEHETKKVPLCLTALEKRLKANKCQEFFFGKKYTMPDFYMIAFAKTNIEKQGKPKLEETFKAHPCLKLYLDKRLIDFP
jgi:glutathione S-transferase